MPFCDERGFAFVHIPKTGGSSIVTSLSSAGVPMRFDQPGLWDVLLERKDAGVLVAWLRRSFGIAELGTFPQLHLPAALLRALAGEEHWQKAFTFAFVRNPWDLMVSSYVFFLKHVKEMEGSGRDADRADMARRCDTFERFVHLYPVMRTDCVEMLAGEGGECIVDFVGRYEHIERDFRTICERIGIGTPALPHVNRTEHGHYRDYYTDSTRSAVARHFERDIDAFGYTF